MEQRFPAYAGAVEKRVARLDAAGSGSLLIWLGAEVQALLSGLGRDLGTYQGDRSWFMPIPATFVVTPAGMITARHIDPDYPRRMDTDDLIRAIEPVR